MYFFTVIHDPDGHIYIRENGGCLLAGGFEVKAKPAFDDGNLPGKKFIILFKNSSWNFISLSTSPIFLEIKGL